MRVAKRLGLMAVGLLLTGSTAGASILLNDTWADADRTNTNLPTDSPTWIGQSAGNGFNNVTAGSLNYNIPTNSLKTWEYFTSDGSAPDTNQPHNAVTQLVVNDLLTASFKFKLPQGATSTSTARNFRFGLFFDSTSARVEANNNTDSGDNTTNPFQDASGYQVQFALNATSGGTNPFQIGKRTNTSQTGLLSSGNSYTFPVANGGTPFGIATNQFYTAQLLLGVVSASQLDVTARILDNTDTVISTYTVSDLGTTFGGTSINTTGGNVPGNMGIYTQFDQMYFRNSDNSQYVNTVTTDPNLNVLNWKVELTPNGVPEPGTMSLLAMGSLLGLRRGVRRWN